MHERLLGGCIRIVADDAISLVPWEVSSTAGAERHPYSLPVLRDGGARFLSGAKYFYGHYFPPRDFLSGQVRESDEGLELDRGASGPLRRTPLRRRSMVLESTRHP